MLFAYTEKKSRDKLDFFLKSNELFFRKPGLHFKIKILPFFLNDYSIVSHLSVFFILFKVT